MTNTQFPSRGLSYRDAGVDIEAGDALVERIKPFARRTMRPEVLEGIGGFGGLVEINQRYQQPVLVSGTDGVGTKLRFAFELGAHATVGIDLVAMSVNDILVQGAEPLFFLDYFACGRLDVDTAATVVQGIALGCEEAGCALIGGETAEMPDMYPDGEYDLAGFAVGVVEKNKIITGATIAAGDKILGIASSGPHSNGYSLIRRIIKESGADLEAPFPHDPLHRTLGAVLMEPTQIYVKPLLDLITRLQVKGMAHITGGGLTENIPRVLPAGLTAEVHRARWVRPPIFNWLQEKGGVDESEMHRVFNCGIGMVVVMDQAHSEMARAILESHHLAVWEIGHIRESAPGEAPTVVI